MSPSQAILTGAVIIAASIVFVNSIKPAEAQRVGPFQLMHNGNPSANSSVFRLDVSTGEVSFCFVGTAGGGQLACTKGVQ